MNVKYVQKMNIKSINTLENEELLSIFKKIIQPDVQSNFLYKKV